MNDWDAVSSDTPPQSATDIWDAVSTPQRVTPPIKEPSYDAIMSPGYYHQEERQIDERPAEAPAAMQGLSPDLAAAIERKRRRQGQPEQEPQVIASVAPESESEAVEQPAPVSETPAPERVYQTRKLNDADIQQEQPEEEVIAAPRRAAQRRTTRPPTRRGGLKGSSIAIIVLCIAVIGLSAFSALSMFHMVNFNRGSVSISAIFPKAAQTQGLTSGQIEATNIGVNADASATALTILEQPPPTAQQIYTQATSGTPAVNDPLTDDTNNWGLFTTNWGGQCAFTGGAYHLSLSKVAYWLVCTGGSMGILKSSANFALQVQISIVQGNYGGIIFGADATPGGASNAYRIDISPVGAFLFYQIQNKQSLLLQQGLDPSIKTGLNKPNVITIIVKNSNFYLYANSQFVISQKLTAYTPGEGDFEALSPDQPTDVAFSNLKVWKL